VPHPCAFFWRKGGKPQHSIVNALQGTTLVVPEMPQNKLGFSPCWDAPNRLEFRYKIAF
jgi:hypothetical protein